MTTTFRDALAATEDALTAAGVWCGHGYESEHDEAVALVLAAAGLPPTTGAEILDQPLAPTAVDRLADYISRRTRDRLPVAYIIGYGFLGPLQFKADARALVPRSPLMEVLAYSFKPWWQSEGDPERIVDVCCGGGSLGLLAAAQFPEADVQLLDIDSAALSLARENLALLKFNNVAITRADLLTPLAAGSVDIVLANPPYVDAEDMATLPPEYLHEPRFALAAGEDGLDLAHKLLLQAADVLRPNGLLFLEVGNSWQTLEAVYPHFAFTWLVFESGGHGVCVLTREELQQIKSEALGYVGSV